MAVYSGEERREMLEEISFVAEKRLKLNARRAPKTPFLARKPHFFACKPYVPPAVPHFQPN